MRDIRFQGRKERTNGIEEKGKGSKRRQEVGEIREGFSIKCPLLVKELEMPSNVKDQNNLTNTKTCLPPQSAGPGS